MFCINSFSGEILCALLIYTRRFLNCLNDFFLTYIKAIMPHNLKLFKGMLSESYEPDRIPSSLSLLRVLFKAINFRLIFHPAYHSFRIFTLKTENHEAYVLRSTLTLLVLALAVDKRNFIEVVRIFSGLRKPRTLQYRRQMP